MDAVFSEWVRVDKTHYISSWDEFQYITNRNFTFIFLGVVFSLLIIWLILPILKLPSKINDPYSIFCGLRHKVFLGISLYHGCGQNLLPTEKTESDDMVRGIVPISYKGTL